MLMQVTRQLLAGLAHIHAQGIIHRVDYFSTLQAVTPVCCMSGAQSSTCCTGTFTVEKLNIHAIAGSQTSKHLLRRPW